MKTVKSSAVMICGTGSDVGKSVIAAGICRILTRYGVAVAPFKSQNMALNSAVTPEGGEIGRAQAVQAQACKIPPHTDMNPILLKPNSETGSQVIVQGVVVGNMGVAEYTRYKQVAIDKVRESFRRLQAEYDFIVMEGAGSIAEINLREHDIANLKMAEMADCPAILVADIDRGGVFAQIAGTMFLLTPEEKKRIAGVIINKFRGDPSLLTPGIEFIEQLTGVPVLGVVPVFSGFRIPEEDSVALNRLQGRQKLKHGEKCISIGVLRLPHISNYTDFDPLLREPYVALTYIESPAELEQLDLLILPGSKSTIADLLSIAEGGFFMPIQRFTGRIIGICGGFQMLGKVVTDPELVEAGGKVAQGLGLLDAETVLRQEKETHQSVAVLSQTVRRLLPDAGAELSGYEIHLGETSVGHASLPFAEIRSRSGRPVSVADGAISPDGKVFGTYLHGIFDNDNFRTSFLNLVRHEKGLPLQGVITEEDPFELLADHLEKHLNMGQLLEICRLQPASGTINC